MAEAGPSYSSNTSAASVSPPSFTKQSTIHFHTEDSHPSLNDKSFLTAPIGLGKPPILRNAIVKPAAHASRSSRSDDDNRRVKPVEPQLPAQRGQRSVDANGSASRRHTTAGRKISRRERTNMASGLAEENGASVLSAFSDEYNLSHEDPQILGEVQRALKLKARREARLRTTSLTGHPKDRSITSDGPTKSSFSTQSSSPPVSFPTLPPLSTHSAEFSAESEVDFSPAIGITRSPLHPVPTSSNGGATLDWSVSASEDEKPDRRWSISIPKRHGKDKAAAASASQKVVENQDSLYADNISRIRVQASSHTLRKAGIISEQLERRYNLVYASLGHHSPTVSYNPVSVVQWYSEQEPAVREALDKTEPLTWLRHLFDGRDKKLGRPVWYITALLAEEYVRHHTTPPTMGTIPEDAVAPVDASPASGLFQDTKSVPSTNMSWTPPHFALEPSISRKRAPSDAQLSFEPHVESGRDSLGTDSRLSSDGSVRDSRVLSVNGAGSPPNSLYSGRAHASPASSRLHLLAKRSRRHRANDSDDNLSSARNSISEQSHSEDGFPKTKRVKIKDGSRFWLINGHRAHGNSTDVDVDDIAAPADDYDAHFGADMRTPKPQGLADLTDFPMSSPNRAVLNRRLRVSLPTTPDFATLEQERQNREEDEERERERYERKAQILEDTLSQNFRIRQLLQRVSANVKEFDSVRCSLSNTLGIPYDSISPEVLDAFTHDPAAVTGNTSALEGWQAVDSIHERILLQRQTLQSFISSLSQGQSFLDMPSSVLKDPISSVMQSMADLETYQSQMVQQAQGVMDALARVKVIHSEVKKEYNDTLSHTSLVYPELSQIVTLEENWRNHYQQFWDFALDALTVLLDTVTPFWRIYGKGIGQDVQDFLIIPWYRNEFTGGPKRYRIKRFPQRSFRHWLGLCFLSSLSVLVVWLQFRAAVSSILHYRLSWITNAGLRLVCIPFLSIAILVQWCAVLVECCIVLAQGGIIIWWLGWAVNLFN